MNGYPKISVVTPSFNQVSFIEETIQSILNQTYTNFEYIIIDGGSTDGSIDLIKRYEDKLTYWISEPDNGQSDAINKGFKQATGELLCWVNSDDVLFPGCLRTIAECYVQRNKPDIIHAFRVYIDEEGRLVRVLRVPRQSRFFFFRGKWEAPAPTVFFKTSSFWKVGGLDTRLRLSMDLDLWLRMMKLRARVEIARKYLGAFRWHSSSKTSVSLNRRGSRNLENPETRGILDEALPSFPEGRRRRWRTVWWRLYQLANLNYLRSYFETQRVKGKHWKEGFGNESYYGEI